MSIKIHSTSDYSRFEDPIAQRPFNPLKAAKIAENMKKRGFLPSFHITVREGANGKLQVLFGAHRWRGAEEAKVPIFYVIDNDLTDQDVLRQENFVQTWTIKDFASANQSLGNENYDILIRFATEYGMSIGVAAKLLDGRSGPSNVRASSFIVLHERRAVKVAQTVNALLEKFGFKQARDSRFIDALSACMRISDFDPQRLLASNSGIRAHLVLKRTTTENIKMIEQVYNYHRPQHLKVDLSRQVEDIQHADRVKNLKGASKDHQFTTENQPRRTRKPAHTVKV